MPRVFAVVVLLALAACRGTAPTGPSSNAFPITGRIIDYRTQAGVAGATIAFANSTFGVREAVGDAGGRYSISIPAFDTYSIRVNGSELTSIGIWTTEYRGDFYVGTAGCRGRYGVVVDEANNRPVQGALVVLVGHRVTTGADGWYYVDDGCTATLPGGTTFMSVTHPGYATAMVGVGRGLTSFQRQDVKLQRS